MSPNYSQGANDIKDHRWFNSLDWNALLQRKKQPPYIPEVKNEGDTSNFSNYPDSLEESKAVKPSEDPFVNW